MDINEILNSATSAGDGMVPAGKQIQTPQYSVDQTHIDQLKALKKRLDSIYNSAKNKIHIVDEGDYPINTSKLGSCRLYRGKNGEKLYMIRHGFIGKQPKHVGEEMDLVDLLVVMHEYGHITLGHMKDDQEDPNSPFNLMGELFDVIQEEGTVLAEEIAKNCGIDVEAAEKLLVRLIDDPDLVHTLLNYAMDMSVNTSVLNANDIHYLEQEVTKKFKKINRFDDKKQMLVSNLEDMVEEDTQAELKKKLREELERLLRKVQEKFLLPESFTLGVDENGTPIPFKDGLAYYEYFRLIISHLDQFVKMLASFKMGKNVDQLSGDDIANALQQQQEEFEYKKGFNRALRDYHERLQGRSDKSLSDYPDESDFFKQGYKDSLEKIAQQLLNEGDNMGDKPQPDGSFFDQDNENQQDQDGNGQGDGDQEGDGQSNGSGNGQGDGEGDGEGQDGDGNCNGGGGGDDDHETPDLDEYLKGMENTTLGDPDDPRTINRKGGTGRGTDHVPSVFRQVSNELDPLDNFLVKLGKSFRNTVTSLKLKRNIMRKHNLRKGSARGNVIIPTYKMKLQKDNEPRVVFLIDVSGSMNTSLIDRVLKTISVSLKKISTATRYDVIAWDTQLCHHYKDLNPRDPISSFPCGGGTDLADGIRFFGLNYKKNSPLVIISDFCDDLNAWDRECAKLPGYKLYGINYGSSEWMKSPNWQNFTELRFK